MTWYIYIVRCADGSLYTGITTDPTRRLHEHNFDNKKAAAYTWSRRPVALVYQETRAGRSRAMKRELEIKGLSRTQKQNLVRNGAVRQERRRARTGQRR
jgi:putative endonuclease